jgi:hypothetical protein
MDGQLTESVELREELATPDPMRADIAKQLAQISRIQLTADGQRVLDFHDAGFGQPVPLLDQVRSQLFGFRSCVVD